MLFKFQGMLRLKQMWLGQGKADATWVFMGWEGIQARLAGIDLHVFRLREHGIPYSYPLLLVITEETQRYTDVSRPVALFSTSACPYLGMLLKLVAVAAGLQQDSMALSLDLPLSLPLMYF